MLIWWGINLKNLNNIYEKWINTYELYTDGIFEILADEALAIDWDF